MPLRVRITDKAMNADNTLTVRYLIAWANAQGVEVWSETNKAIFQADVTRAQVLNDVQELAKARAKLVQASIGLDADINKTYELQSDGTWKVV